MNLRSVAKTGLKISEIGFGSYGLSGETQKTRKHSTYGPVDEREALKAMEYAFESGCNLIDTADHFGNGYSETIIGKFIRLKRRHTIVATKFGNLTLDNPALKRPIAGNIKFFLEESLKRLQTDFIDIFIMFFYDSQAVSQFRVDETLCLLKEQGKIRHFGAVINTMAQAEALVKNDAESGFTIAEVTYNACSLENENIIKYLASHNIGVFVKEPLANGLLTGKYSADKVWDEKDIRAAKDPIQRQIRLEMAQQLAPILTKPDRTLTQSLLKFVLQTSGVSCVMPGCRTSEEAKENFSTAACPDLTEAEIQQIRAVEASLKTKYGTIQPQMLAG